MVEAGVFFIQAALLSWWPWNHGNPPPSPSPSDLENLVKERTNEHSILLTLDADQTARLVHNIMKGTGRKRTVACVLYATRTMSILVDVTDNSAGQVATCLQNVCSRSTT